MPRRLLLVGGGHAHLEVLRSLRTHPLAGVEVTVVAPEPVAAYTGMVPGMLAGEYGPDQLAFDLRALCAAAGARFVEAAVDGVDGTARVAWVLGTALSFDACSINAGSAPAGSDLPGVRAHAIPLRPLSNALRLCDRIDALVGGGVRGPAAVDAWSATPGGEGSVPMVVVGGGAAGVEVAIALALRGAGRAAVTLVHDRDRLLDGASARASALAARACARAGVALRLGSRVAAVQPDAVIVAGGARVASMLTVWLAGAAPPPLLRTQPLPLTATGFLEVDDTLRATSGDPVWGAGDCAMMRGAPWVPRAGVYAVRQGAILAHNLRAALTGHGAARTYEPQRAFLSLLLSGERHALLAWRGLAVDTRWARWLKRRIDLRFMRRHTV